MSPAATQTRSRLLRLLTGRGLHPRRDLGQNFLIDLNLLRLIVQQAELDAHDVVLEIGAGTGSLTSEIAPQAAAVVAVEYDRNLYEIAAECLAAFPNVTLLNCDALESKSRLSAAVLSAVAERMAAVPGGRLKLVANLPYNIATPLVSNLVASELPWERMVITIQLELAERMLAAPSTPQYGALSVWLQAQCDLEIVRRLPPSVFWPRPNVESAIVRIRPNPQKRARIVDRAFFQDYLRRVFQQRRKQLRGVLGGIGPGIDRRSAEVLLVELGCGDHVRAEALDVATHVELSNRLAGRMPSAAGV